MWVLRLSQQWCFKWRSFGCYVMYCFGRIPVFQTSMLPPFSEWNMDLWNSIILPQHYTLSQHRRPQLETSVLYFNDEYYLCCHLFESESSYVTMKREFKDWRQNWRITDDTHLNVVPSRSIFRTTRRRMSTCTMR